MNSSPKPVFYCQGIVKCYEGKPVVSGIDLELNAGGLISLVGASGIGKTTLFNILAGVDSPDSGQIFLNEEEITGRSGLVSYMMQKDLLLEYRTTLDNVILPLLIRGQKKKAAREYASDFFPQFGLAGYEKKYPRQLSGGMRQRAALLRCCLQNAVFPGNAGIKHPVILLDEPFSSLDALTRRSMQDWFQNIMTNSCLPGKAEQISPLEDQRLSALFITHDVEEAIFLSDKVYVLGGNPGTITAIFPIDVPRPRNREFSLTTEFALLKKEILDAVEGS
jgi:ABC-type nitrate/sulfonate/bicarbonate transport system ATPase subunit